MKIKRFIAKDIRQAMRMVKEELGGDAVIMSNRSVGEGVEIVAAKDFDEQTIHSKLNARGRSNSEAENSERKIELADFETEKNNLHVISSSRKVGGDGTIPKKSSARIRDKYVGYAEKIHLAGKKAIKHKVVANQQPVMSVKSSNHQRQDDSLSYKTITDHFTREMRKEIKTLRSAFDTKLAEISWNQDVKSNPVRFGLLQRLAQMGFSKKIGIKIANRLDSYDDSEFAFQKAKEMLTKVLPVADDNLLQTGGVVALVGPTGVGKTTTIAKLAAKFILKHGSDKVAIITTDNYRIGAHEQIATYGRLLDVPVKIATNANELQSHINSFNDKRLILIDTAGMSQRDMRLADQIQILQQKEVSIKTYLVMSAASQYKAMNEIVHAFKIFQPEFCILTKLDETTTQGSSLSAIIEHQLPVSFLTNGQQVPEDIYVPVARTLIEQCAAGLDEENQVNDEFSYEGWIAEGYV